MTYNHIRNSNKISRDDFRQCIYLIIPFDEETKRKYLKLRQSILLVWDMYIGKRKKN